ncbi:PREDICTED: ubiquinone biosynthesis O-methyltransferase, mitochondrial [Rhagoletis zephyria]|uniref:ubiquinone biosynthesis O-methyltransferase, mitochondrial n=1 Tax=Rhagoletis zephyria TaxID=28612 RepID=UPI00081149D9|nr:PREDICTED: ubiquinone biosynthesis O-methyltransferase, mitochondrial [Rhagoletis zephyria]
MACKAVKFVSPLLRTHRYLLLNNIINIRYAQTSTNGTYTSTSDTSSAKTQKETRHSASTQKEINHHANLSSTWWDINGPMHGLHKLNELRVPLVRDGMVTRGTIDRSLMNTSKVLQGKNILEVGCGGGILTEPLARLSANVTGIDLGEDVITTARTHLESHSPELKDRITYKIEPVEVHAKSNSNYYDAVVCSEVLEHIDDKAGFLTHCVHTLKPGGSIFITTMNKTIPLWLGGILLGEYVFGIAPKNTHHWDKLVSPLDVQRILSALNCQTVLTNGYTYDVIRRRWRWINTNMMCYAIQAIKAE